MLRAAVRLARDDVDGALEDHQKALALARQAEDPQGVLPILGTGIHLYVQLGRLDEARTLAREAQDYGPAVAAKYVHFPLTWNQEQLGLSTEDLTPYRAQLPADLPGREVHELISSGRFDEAADRFASRRDAVTAGCRLAGGPRRVGAGLSVT